jgi:hypothetical protein
MVRKGYTAEQIISRLRKAEVMLSQGNAIKIVCNKFGALLPLEERIRW